MDILDQNESDNANGDGDGVWSPEIEQCFREALVLYPPCGRRKHILAEEGAGKMYGRNELIARYIKMCTGKSRTRKQVSSHIQVLARRRAKADAGSTGSEVSLSPSSISGTQSQSISRLDDHLQPATFYDIWMDRPIVTTKIRLVEFSAFIEHRNFQSHQNGGLGINNVATNSQAATTKNPINGLANTTAEQLDLSFLDSQQQTNQMQAFTHQPYQPSHPLASNHHLPAQFNQATSYQAANQFQSHNPQKSKPIPGAQGLFSNPGSYHIMPLQPTPKFTRHSYVQIDYTQALNRQTNRLEKIVVRQIQDKFPDLVDEEGLFQRGPPDVFFLVKFWADLNNNYDYNIEDQNSCFGFSSHFETIQPYEYITCSTKACSYGMKVVEKVEKIYGKFNNSNGRYSYNVNKSPMCDFMIHFIKKLRQLQQEEHMNSVLENFTVLQVVTIEPTKLQPTPEVLLCLAYVFEVSSANQNNGPQHRVYKLIKD